MHVCGMVSYMCIACMYSETCYSGHCLVNLDTRCINFTLGYGLKFSSIDLCTHLIPCICILEGVISMAALCIVDNVKVKAAMTQHTIRIHS